MQRNKPNLIVTKTFDFALSIVDFVEELGVNKQYSVVVQLLKSGTSIGANVREAQNAESLKDFIHKMKIAAKEADETEYWLELIHLSRHFPECDDLLIALESIHKILSKIISSSIKRHKISK